MFKRVITDFQTNVTIITHCVRYYILCVCVNCFIFFFNLNNLLVYIANIHNWIADIQKKNRFRKYFWKLTLSNFFFFIYAYRRRFKNEKDSYLVSAVVKKFRVFPSKNVGMSHLFCKHSYSWRIPGLILRRCFVTVDSFSSRIAGIVDENILKKKSVVTIFLPICHLIN